MSLQIAAQHLASRGRGPDTQLVHMAPQEVAGLHALARAHGGELTTNPDTGLPEAGFLSSILPMVIGAGLTVASGGTLTPLMAAGITGAGYGVATGSLSKGLMAGLGAYGGAGLAGGLTAAGAGVAPGIAGTTEAMAGGFGPGVVAPVAPSVAPVAPMAGPDLFGGTAGEIGAAYGYTPPPAAAAAAAPSPIQAQQAVMQAAPQTVTPMADRFAQAGRGLGALGTEAGREAFMSAQGVGGMGGLMKYGYAAGLPMLMQEPKKQAEKEKLKPYEYTYSPGRVQNPEADYTGAFTGERTYFNPSFTRVGNYAEGGSTKAVPPVEEDPYYTMSGQSGDMYKYLMGQMPSAPAAPMPTAPAAAPTAAVPTAAAPAYEARSDGEYVDDTSNLLKSYTFDPVTGGFTPVAAPKVFRPFTVAGPMSNYGNMDGGMGVGAGEGGGIGGGMGGGMSNSGEGGGGPGEGGWAVGGLTALARGGQSHLGDYSDGGRMLRGPGDGVSDSIPATIGGKRPARLADGEFVVPARIVSELGNGSSEAGARKLYAMMDRVQKARGKTTGKNRVAVNSRAEKLLPV